MDALTYKHALSKRGLKYSYFVILVPQSTKPVLLFLHGFPSTSYDWRHQVAFFTKRGYGAIVPDLLGYGGTDKPLDMNSYRFSGMCADVIDIMDSECIPPGKTIAIGHDWGCGLTSRLANFYPDRFLAFAFLAAGYAPPSTKSYEEQTEHLKQFAPYELYGYWKFFSEPGADKIIESHWDSFTSMMFTANPKLWRASTSPSRGGMKEFLLANHRPPTAPYWTAEDKTRMAITMRDPGIAAALNWYKTQTSGIAADDNRQIPRSRYAIPHPVFFGAAKQDYVCLPAIGLHAMRPLCLDLTVREFDADHWVQLALPNEVNEELLAWIKGVEGKARL